VRGNRLGVAVAAVAAVLLVLAVVLVPRLVGGDEEAVGTVRSGDAGTSAATEPPDESSGLDQVVEYDVGEVRHTEDRVDYAQSPPVGGDHAPQWLECGAYDEPVREENAVHSLEHGTVWITYDPDLRAGDVDVLERQLPEKGILSPYDGLPAPVVVTVWNLQLALIGADDPRLADFVAAYGDGGSAPEPFASCAGGVSALESQDS
jgi:hypothetical protein